MGIPTPVGALARNDSIFWYRVRILPTYSLFTITYYFIYQGDGSVLNGFSAEPSP